jgi:hypothetical protein
MKIKDKYPKQTIEIEIFVILYEIVDESDTMREYNTDIFRMEDDREKNRISIIMIGSRKNIDQRIDPLYNIDEILFLLGIYFRGIRFNSIRIIFYSHSIFFRN